MLASATKHKSISDTRWAAKNHLMDKILRTFWRDFKFFRTIRRITSNMYPANYIFLEDEDANNIVQSVFSRLLGIFL